MLAAEDGTAGWHSLPREVEAMVLSHLQPLHALRLAAVCSSWHSAVRTAHVWRELKFTSGRVCARLLNEHLGRMSISFGTAVRRVELHGMQLITDQGVEMLLQWCTHLRALSIQRCPHVVRLCAKHVREDFQEFRLKAKWSNPLSLRVLEQGWAASVRRLVDKCGASLRVLALRVQFSTVDATSMIQHIARQCGPRLRELSLDEITDLGMEALALNCPNLCVVDCTTGIQFAFALKEPAPASFVSVCRSATSLRHLRFLSVPYEYLPRLVALAEFTRLETLELDGMNDDLQDDDGVDGASGDAQITPATMLSDIVGKFPRLRSLGLTNYELPLTFFSASSLGTTATSLTSLNLTGSSPAEIDVEAIGSEMPHLEELDVTQSGLFDDALVEAFCRGHDRRRSRLRVFKVTDTGVTVDGVKMLIEACPRLESVGEYGPWLATDEKLAGWSAARWSTLALTFNRDTAVTSQGLQRFFEAGGGRAVRVVIATGPGIAFDLSALTALLDGCPRLERLHVTAMAAVDDACVAALALHAPPSLLLVQLASCPVTEECVRKTAARVGFVLDVRFNARVHKAM